MIWIFVAAIAASVLATLSNWRLGVPLAIVIGALQDPIRKLTPGQPVVMVLSSVPVWIAVWVSLLSRHPRVAEHLTNVHPDVRAPLRFFLLALLPATVLALDYGPGSWRLALLGLFSYLAPLLTVLVGYAYVRSPGELRRLLIFYCGFTSLMLVGTALEYTQAFPGWAALGITALATEGGGGIRHMGFGQAIRLLSGFYRSPDIMAWHAATVTMIGLTLAMTYASAGRKLGAIAAIAAALWGAACVIMGGRRKAIVMPLIWTITAVLLLARGRGRGSDAVALLGVVATAAGAVVYAAGELELDPAYIVYATSAATDAPARLLSGSVGEVLHTVRQFGLFGAGIGTASQGRQYAGSKVATWQESGLSKLMVELGLPGFVATLALTLALGVSLWRTTRSLAATTSSARMCFGLLALLTAAASSFLVSHQTYSDVIILSLTALFPGVLLSASRWQPKPAPRPSLRAVPGADHGGRSAAAGIPSLP